MQQSVQFCQLLESLVALGRQAAQWGVHIWTIESRDNHWSISFSGPESFEESAQGAERSITPEHSPPGAWLLSFGELPQWLADQIKGHLEGWELWIKRHRADNHADFQMHAEQIRLYLAALNPQTSRDAEKPELVVNSAGSAKGFIERLLAGPEDVGLTPRELALLAAYLDNYQLPLSAVQQEERATGKSATMERLRKLRTIRDFNRNLQGATPPPTAPDGKDDAAVGRLPAATGQGDGTAPVASRSNTTKKRRGRPPKAITQQRAQFAKKMVDKGLMWSEIAERYRKRHPEDEEATADVLRRAFERTYPAR